MSESRDEPPTRPRLAIIAGLVIAVTGCAGSPSVLDPVSEDGSRVERLWWVMLGISALVFLVVLFFLFGSLLRRNRRVEDVSGDFGRKMVLWGGLIIPVVILIGVFSLSSVDLQAMAAGDDKAGMEVVVTGEQWWWRVEYPDQGVVTANEIHVPTGTEIRFVLRSGDVIHSLWVPQAGPKRDMIPGRTNELVLSFDRADRYKGICSEFCGLQHAQMQFEVVAQPQEGFATWIDEQSSPARSTEGASERGLEVFLSSPCVGCHTVRGVSEAGQRGPDLTHLASRETIGAGALPFTEANLRAWVRSPGDLKPGVLMPPSDLSPSDMADLIAYLGTLR